MEYRQQHAVGLEQQKAFLGAGCSMRCLAPGRAGRCHRLRRGQHDGRLGEEFSGDELLRLSGQQFGGVTVTRQEISVATKRARSVPPFLDWNHSEKRFP